MRSAELAGNFTSAADRADINIPVYVHIVSSGESVKDGNIADDVVTKQIEVINENYGVHNITFTLKNVSRTVNEEWATQDTNGPMQEALHQGDYATLNLYIVSDRRYLGICQFPEEPTEDVIAHDGCVIVASSVPGGVAPFDQGKTATHEIGHWFGLFHTFQDQSCSSGGDGISDTPQQLGPTSGCPTNADSCPDQPGLDAVNNYMDYSDDSCYEEFTPEQEQRMYNMYQQYRAPAAAEQISS
ncbi:extracellular metalloprotease [Pseudovirgaria hyperparasitica]|uniref:Extracellular metalloprotease n=1 Tax=Pseudovirgaria hyperparasitica TaxID=470096 RepID=A0A6A6VU99_9PEZI|nr:extracellular metalloprotease [Pseudovirgaria hyperparasitica]KAF2754152.1 extracellular metalloprotease [Pseudovirgaria hyperparasitica]